MSELCSRLESVFSPYVDGELTPAEAAPVREHLAACGACTARVAAYEAMRQRIVGARFPALAPDVALTLLRRARQPVVVRWSQLAAAVLLACVIPAGIALTAPKRAPLAEDCGCDVVTPSLDSGL